MILQISSLGSLYYICTYIQISMRVSVLGGSVSNASKCSVLARKCVVSPHIYTNIKSDNITSTGAAMNKNKISADASQVAE